MDRKMKRRAIFFWILILIAFIYSLIACTPVQRLNKFQKKHPYLFEKKIDTLTIYDTTEVILPGVKFDTTFKLYQMSTPGGLTLNKDHFHLHIFHDTITNNVNVDAKVDTIYQPVYKVIKVPYNQYIVDKPKPWVERNKNSISFLLILAIVIYITVKIYQKQKQPPQDFDNR